MPHRADHILPFLNRNIKRKLPDGTLEFQDDTKLMEGLLGIGQEEGGVGFKGGERTSPLPFKPAVQEDKGGLVGKIAGGIASPFVAAGKGIVGASRKFADVAGDPEQSPGLQRLLGTIATALSAVEPASFQQQLGQAAVSSAAGKQADLLRGGAELTGVGGFGISPQERASLVSEALAEREVGAREITAGAAETGAEARMLSALTGEREAISGRDRLKLEYAKLEKPGAPGEMIDVAINQDGSLSDRLHKYEWNPKTGNFDIYRGPKLEPGAGRVGAGKEVERFKPLTIKEREVRLDSVTKEASRFLTEGGVKEPGFFTGGDWEKNDLVKHAQQRSNPFDTGSDKWARFEAARPFMDVILALEDVKDKADVTEAEGQRLLDTQNNIDTLRRMTDTDYTEYVKRIKAGADPSELLTLFRRAGGGR